MWHDAEIASLRAEIPAIGAGIVHLNHAGASLPSARTLSVIKAHLDLEASLGPMEAATAVQDQLASVRVLAAELINAKSNEIAFAPSGSAAWGLAFAALPALNAGDRILVSRQEWGGNLATLQAAARRAGATIETMPVHDDGSVDVARLADRMEARVRLLALTWLPANGGLIQNASAIGIVARASACPYFVDASQALGHIPVDVQAIGCDVLKGAGRKYLRGPRGTALLYVRQDFQSRLVPPYLDVASAPLKGFETLEFHTRQDARCLESSEQSVALLLGLGCAIKQAQDLGIHRIAQRIQTLSQKLREALSTVPGIRILDLGSTQNRSGLVSFALADKSAYAVQAYLGGLGIHIGANGTAYTPLDMQARGLTELARASLHYFNTDSDIEKLVSALRTLARSTT